MNDYNPFYNLSKSKRAYFKAAEAIASMSNHRCKMGCVVVNGHKIISSGHNSASKTHPLQNRLDKHTFKCECAGFLHAETDALIPLINNRLDLSKATIFVYRKMGNKTGMARPCSRCMSIIKQCGIRFINYSTNNGFAEEMI